jgi:hypothetical protein
VVRLGRSMAAQACAPAPQDTSHPGHTPRDMTVTAPQGAAQGIHERRTRQDREQPESYARSADNNPKQLIFQA